MIIIIIVLSSVHLVTYLNTVALMAVLVIMIEIVLLTIITKTKYYMIRREHTIKRKNVIFTITFNLAITTQLKFKPQRVSNRGLTKYTNLMINSLLRPLIQQYHTTEIHM